MISRPRARLASIGFLLSGLVISFVIGGFVTGCGSSSKSGASSTGATAISADAMDTCALFSGGTVKCWGFGLLTGSSKNEAGSSIPVALSGIKNAAAISAEGFGLGILLRSGKVMTIAYQHGEKNRTTPTPFTGVTASAGNEEFSCAVLTDKTVKCWGPNNEVGQLGNGYSGTADWGTLKLSLNPVAVSGITNATAISVGLKYGCALLSDGTVECWGAGAFLGDGVTDHGHSLKAYGDFSPTPVVVSGITNAVAISAGLNHTCALLSDSTVKCWGNFTNHGVTGDPEYHSTPIHIAGITKATAISAAGDHNCAVISGGTVKCWGSNDVGQLGNGTMKDSPTPVTVNDIANASAISAGGGFSGYTCALLSGGAVKCWGWNTFGQLGDGTTKNRSTPVNVVDLTS
jgi:alpha-tubulin suppressor-like RCC1 family protein